MTDSIWTRLNTSSTSSAVGEDTDQARWIPDFADDEGRIRTLVYIDRDGHKARLYASDIHVGPMGAPHVNPREAMNDLVALVRDHAAATQELAWLRDVVLPELRHQVSLYSTEIAEIRVELERHREFVRAYDAWENLPTMDQVKLRNSARAALGDTT